VHTVGYERFALSAEVVLCSIGFVLFFDQDIFFLAQNYDLLLNEGNYLALLLTDLKQLLGFRFGHSLSLPLKFTNTQLPKPGRKRPLDAQTCVSITVSRFQTKAFSWFESEHNLLFLLTYIVSKVMASNVE